MERSGSPGHVLSPSMLGHYIEYNSCPRYFRYRTNNADMRYERNWWDEESLGVFLSEVGTSFESDQLRTLSDDAAEIVGLPSDEEEFEFAFDDTWSTAAGELTGEERRAEAERIWQTENKPNLEGCIERTAERTPGDGPTVLYQLPMRGQIEYWEVSGLSDILLLYPTAAENTVRSLLIEVKSSWAAKSSHQIQAAVYSLLLDNVVDELGYDHDASAAIVHREQDLRNVDRIRDELDTFDIDSRITEVRRLLREDGELHTLYEQEFEDVGYTLERKCDSCEFNEICYTKAVESKDLGLLGLSQGDREKLTEHGIHTVNEFAALYEREEDKRPYEFEPLSVTEDHQDTVRELSAHGRLGTRLPELVQRAQLLSGTLDPTYDEFDFVEFLKGTGNGKLPEDSPRGRVSPPYPEQSLIRAYLYVQTDYVRDRVVLTAARINGHHIEPRTVVELGEELPMEKAESRRVEGRLLERFFTRLFQELRTAARETRSSGVAVDADEAYFHLYCYSQNERDALVDAVKRNPTLSGSDAVRDLLGLREGLDQAMVSTVHSEITGRLALHYPGTGLVQTVEQLVTEGWRVGEGYHDRTTWSNDQWTVSVDGERIDLRSIFRRGLFERYKPYTADGDSISLVLDGGGRDEPDGFYPVRNRFGSQIPLEYIWGVNGELTAFLDEKSETQQRLEATEDPSNSYELDKSVLPYLYRDHRKSSEDRERIRRSDVEALAKRLCYATEHVERSIRFKNTFLGKKPLPFDLPTFGLPDVSLAESCQEYISLEHATTEQDLLEHYMDPPIERVKSGESTFFRVTDIEERETRFGTEYRITGELLYDEYFAAPDRVLDSCKVSGGDGSSSGSWMVMTPLEPDGSGGFDQVGIRRPAHVHHSANATVESFDRNENTIVVTAGDEPTFFGDNFVTWHRGLTSPAEYDEKSKRHWWSPLRVGSVFVLDPTADSWPHERAYDALEHAGTNYLYSVLQQAYNEGRTEQFDVGFCDPDDVEEFLDVYEEALEIAPKGKQREFIEHAESAVSVLQGPPGTGKTGFTLAPSVLSRLYAYEKNDRALTCAVTGPSHTSVNEALEDVYDRLEEYRTASETVGLENVKLFRVGGSSGGFDVDVPHVDYYDSDDINAVRDALSEADDETHVVLFATPTSMRGLVDKLVKRGFAPVDGAEEFMAAGGSLYEFLVIDEASMLDLPNTLLVGSFLADGGQTLFIGDHRQMEPVQVHEWESEDRRTIEENVPFMSALNFVRFLRGDLSEVEFAEQQSPELGDAIPMVGLDRTYRMHTLLAELLSDLVYQDDGIELKSDRTETLSNVRPSTPGIDTAMDPDAPVVLLIHDEDASQDANLTEIAIIEGLLSALEGSTDEDIGIVTPHNAQKGRLRDRLGDVATPNTVEKFQGGERDVICVSATASDPDYVRAESDFLLNPNRLNVAMSRMKKKLIVVASESVFRVIPTDADEYDDAVIWKRLYGRMGVLDAYESEASYSLAELLPDDVESDGVSRETSVSIYTLRSRE